MKDACRKGKLIMPLEEEVHSLLQVGFYGIMFISLVGVMFLIMKYKNYKLIVFLVFLILFTCAGYNLLSAINVGRSGVPVVMQSEEASMSIGIAGILWAISMFFFIFGLFSLVNERNGNQKKDTPFKVTR